MEQPVDTQALSTDQFYYALEFSSIPKIYTHDRVKAFILLANEYEKHLMGIYDHGKQQAIEDIERSYPTALRVLVGRLDAEIIRRREERKATCTHENGILSLYDKHQTDYTLQGGKPVANNEDLEPDLLYEVDFCCSQCDTCISYPDWRKAPEPIRTYASRCFHMESAT
ncbi:hypothetical protein KSF_107710 [Reticulibacter mediterranei]|uniref:Uncharacterized protein n=1 Tax=Reticulibacter mediterranei TaxID=2778369 RepID=A0A8J3IYB0_9CHLR|nr:hypothetical protein [Reticulibacter mediterranei]GHP00724.1 hypothetical protein KSF_107710 [Reticulibacter mediterranei]